MKILFICEGNMNRSVMAEAFYNEMTGTSDASSAGTLADEQETHTAPWAAEVMRERGIVMEQHHAVRLTDDMARSADLVVMFPTHYMPPVISTLPHVRHWDVIDPGYHADQGIDLVRQVRDEIEQRVGRLIGEQSAS